MSALVAHAAGDPAPAAASLLPASWPRAEALDERMLRVDLARGSLRDDTVGGLGDHVRRDDLLVVNDAATLPASLAARAPSGARIEVRLLGPPGGSRARVVLLGRGDWRTPTEHRDPPPPLPRGSVLSFDRLSATVVAVSPESPRLVDVIFHQEGAALWSTLYRAGRSVQYAYVARPLSLWHTQTVYAGRPWAVEQPSAGRPLRWSLLLALRRRGVRLASVTHAAGLSSTGDPIIDAMLPMPERYQVPPATVEAVASARAAGGRVIAIGTSATRALESAALGGTLVAGAGVTDLRLGPTTVRRVVDGLLTGMHEPGGSHHALLQAFASAELLARAHAHAMAEGYLCHEFGDSCLIL